MMTSGAEVPAPTVPARSDPAGPGAVFPSSPLPGMLHPAVMGTTVEVRVTPPSAVTLRSGRRSRVKRFLAEGLGHDEVAARLGAA
jgi:hypothetical protein